MKKGDVLTVAQIAGILGAKKTPELIPLCHVLPLSSVNVTFGIDKEAGWITAECTVIVTEGDKPAQQRLLGDA